MGRRQSLTAAARGYSLDDVSAGLPAPEPVDGQLELPWPERTQQKKKEPPRR
jgi:hypothetical protein